MSLSHGVTRLSRLLRLGLCDHLVRCKRRCGVRVLVLRSGGGCHIAGNDRALLRNHNNTYMTSTSSYRHNGRTRRSQARLLYLHTQGNDKLCLACPANLRSCAHKIERYNAHREISQRWNGLCEIATAVSVVRLRRIAKKP
jgi:hypothetical protein